MQTETTIKWEGEEYVVPLSMALVNRIENADVNLVALSFDIASGAIPKTSLVATMYTLMLNAAGCPVSSEEVWEAMLKGASIEITQFANAAINAFFPEFEEDEEAEPEEVKK